MEEKIIKRSEAIEKNYKFYFTGKPCKNNHISKRRVLGHICLECERENAKKPKRKLYSAQYFIDNKEKLQGLNSKRSKENKEKTREYSRKHEKNNKEKRKEKNRNWRINNLAYDAYRSKLRRERKRKACPQWLSKSQLEQIKNFYYHAKDCEIISGQKYHVDHIIPLKGKDICGLHVPWNLQILPDDINLSKGNYYV